MKKNLLTFLSSCTVILIFLLLYSCGSDKQNRNPGPDKSSGVEYTYDVKYNDNTKIINENTVGKLISADKKSGVYKFEPDAAEVESLRPGEIVIFAGHSLRKVVNVENTGNEIIVNTEYATLNQAVTDGKISWEKTIDWRGSSDKVNTASFVIDNVIFTSEDKREFKINYKGKLSGWDIELSLEPEQNKLKIELKGEKSLNGQKVCKITGKGFISQFTHSTSMTFERGKLINFNSENRGLRGELNINFAAVGLGGDIAYMNIPAKIKIPFLIAGVIPASLNMSATLKVYPEIKKGASSQGSYKLTYDSDMGFRYENNNAKLNSKLNNQDMEITGETVTAGVVTTGIGIGFEFPRFELAVLGETIVPYFLINISAKNIYEPGILSGVQPCQQGALNLKCISGIDFKFLGLEYKVQKTHYEKEKKWNRGPGCDD